MLELIVLISIAFEQWHLSLVNFWLSDRVAHSVTEVVDFGHHISQLWGADITPGSPVDGVVREPDGCGFWTPVTMSERPLA